LKRRQQVLPHLYLDCYFTALQLPLWWISFLQIFLSLDEKGLKQMRALFYEVVLWYSVGALPSSFWFNPLPFSSLRFFTLLCKMFALLPVDYKTSIHLNIPCSSDSSRMSLYSLVFFLGALCTISLPAVFRFVFRQLC
jgi:hypothetical protein